MEDTTAENKLIEFARDVWITRAKLAVALSLIKTKPPSQTGEEYTRLLAQKIRKWQLGLRSTNKTLQDENLRLRHKLTVHELGAGDSGFSSDGELRLSQPQPGGTDTPFTEHILFFQSLLSIKSYVRSSESGQLQSRESTLSDPLCQSLACIFRFLADHKLITSVPSRTIEDATRSVLNLCDQNDLCDVIVTSCLEFAEDLLREIVHVDLDGQRHYSHLISLLGQSRHLWVKLCDRLVREVHQFGRVFREQLDPIQFDAVYAILHSLEVIWGYWSQPDNAKKVAATGMVQKWRSLLDSSLRHIWEHVPLFHIYVSFLLTLLAQLDKALTQVVNS